MQTLDDKFKKQYGIVEASAPLTGGQKTVYIITTSSGERMALKFFTLHTKRDFQELEILTKLNLLPGISKIVKIEDYNGRPIIFEEFIDAPDLEDIIESYHNDSTRVINLIKNIIEILSPVWKDKIVHRDLKPKNIKILPNGTPVIMDFGIARDLSAESLTATGDTQPMSWDYASPEQFSNDKGSISYRTDFFSLGVIAYRLYYQTQPFGTTREEIAQKFTKGDNAIALTQNDPLNNFFTSALSIDPSGRPRTIEMLLSTL